ncbi:cell wall-binding repeat-containing protein [Salana multivorans]
MRQAVRTALTATAVLATVGLIVPAATAEVEHINDGVRDPELNLGATAKAGKLYRFQGANRVETAWSAAAHTDYMASGTELGRVALLASSTEFADALAAAPLAETLSAPVLLANEDGSLSSKVAEELATYETVIVVSGRGLIPETTAGALRAREIDVVRYAGSTRFDTAATLGLASLYWSSKGQTPAPGTEYQWTAYLADGFNFPDALAAGPAAALDTNGVVLLTGNGALGSVTEAALSGRISDVKGVDADVLEPLSAWWAGTSVETELAAMAVGGEATRAADAAHLTLTSSFVGADRYETAALVAKRSIERSIVTTSFAVANGEAFPDAVVAGAYAGNIGAPLLLTRTGSLPKASADVLGDRALNTSTVVVFGGEGSVSRQVSREAHRPSDLVITAHAAGRAR